MKATRAQLRRDLAVQVAYDYCCYVADVERSVEWYGPANAVPLDRDFVFRSAATFLASSSYRRLVKPAERVAAYDPAGRSAAAQAGVNAANRVVSDPFVRLVQTVLPHAQRLHAARPKES